MRRHVNPHYQQLSPTLAYLRECVGSRFDWTSAATTFEPATHIKAAAARYFGQSESLKRSPPRGEPVLLKAIEDYFHRCGIRRAPSLCHALADFPFCSHAARA